MDRLLEMRGTKYKLWIGRRWSESAPAIGSGFAQSALVRSPSSGLIRRWWRGEGGRGGSAESVCGRRLAGGGRSWPENPGRVGRVARVVRSLGEFFGIFRILARISRSIYRKILELQTSITSSYELRFRRFKILRTRIDELYNFREESFLKFSTHRKSTI